MKSFILDEYKKIVKYSKNIDKNVLIIFISVAVLQTISWYFSSRDFFRENFYYQYFNGNINADLYEFLYWFFTDSFTLLIIPLLIIKFILKRRISDFGLKFGDYKTGLKFLFVFTLLIIVLTFILSSIKEFEDAYPFLKTARHDFKTLIIFELSALIYMFAWEFIWRGFMFFGLEEKFGLHAIIIQMLPFVILHNGKPFVETLSAIIGALLLGYIAFRTRSIYYGVAIHFVLFFSMDLFVFLRIN